MCADEEFSQKVLSSLLKKPVQGTKPVPIGTGFVLRCVFRCRNKVRIQLDADAGEHNQLLAYA